MWKSVPILLAATLLAMAAWAQSTGNLEQYLRADHPDSYVVQKGDTLWDISSRFLQKPWQWPELWRANPQIENPHLIYPSDIIRLVYIEGQPALVLERGEASRTYKASPSTDAKLSPKIRATPLETAIPAINLADALVAPDLLRPHLVNWVEVVGYFIRSVEADAAADGTAETAALLKRLLAYEGVQAAVNAPPESPDSRCER